MSAEWNVHFVCSYGFLSVLLCRQVANFFLNNMPKNTNNSGTGKQRSEYFYTCWMVNVNNKIVAGCCPTTNYFIIYVKIAFLHVFFRLISKLENRIIYMHLILFAHYLFIKELKENKLRLNSVIFCIIYL